MNNLMAYTLPELPINISYLTIVAAVILLIGFIVGIKKGILKSLKGIIVFVGSIALTIVGTPYVLKYTENISFLQSLPSAVVTGIGAIVTFIVARIIFGIIFWLIGKIFRSRGDGRLNPINRILGAVFQTALAFLIVIVLCYVLTMFSNVSFLTPIYENAVAGDAFGKMLIEKNFLGLLLDKLSEMWPLLNEYVQVIKDAVASLVPQG